MYRDNHSTPTCDSEIMFSRVDAALVLLRRESMMRQVIVLPCLFDAGRLWCKAVLYMYMYRRVFIDTVKKLQSTHNQTAAARLGSVSAMSISTVRYCGVQVGNDEQQTRCFTNRRLSGG